MVNRNPKKRILFVVSEFYQAGTQRFTYEVDRALNKDLFEVELLCLLPLHANPHFTDYYFEKHLALGTKVHFLSDIDKRLIPTFWQRLRRLIAGIPLPDERIPLRTFFNRFEKIAVMGEYNYKEIARFISSENQQKLLIHVQNSKYQKEDLYAAFDKEQSYHFVSGFFDDQLQVEFSEFTNYRHTYFNLNLRFDPIVQRTDFYLTDNPRIGIFTRLTYTKPITPFIEVFAQIKRLKPTCQLHIFGAGDPEEEGVMKIVRELSLTQEVFFRGHQPDLTATVLKENIDIAFVHGYHGLPGGWVSFDLSRAGIPQLFWDFGHSASAAFNEVFPMFQNTNDMANSCIAFLNDSFKLEQLAQGQFKRISDKHDIEKNIHVLEQIYSSY